MAHSFKQAALNCAPQDHESLQNLLVSMGGGLDNMQGSLEKLVDALTGENEEPPKSKPEKPE